MAEQTTSPPRLSPDDLVQFVETHRPRLKAGDYSVEADHTIKVEGDDTNDDLHARGKLNFAVAGERYTVREEEIHSLFPAPAAHGAYHRVLPHILLTRSTLPWERSPRGDGSEQFLSPSWLALLLFTEAEKPEVTTLKVGSSAPEGEKTGLKKESLVADAIKPGTAAWRPLPDEVMEHPEESVRVIDVPWKLLKQQIPSYEDLSLLSHVRHIDPALKPTNTKQGSPELAAIFGNRLPPAGEHCIMHLVSLEECYTSPEATNDRPYALAWQDDHEVFELNGEDKAALKELLIECRETLNHLRSELLTNIQNATPDFKRALRRQLVRLAVQLQLNSGQPPTLLAPLPNEFASQPVPTERIKALLNPHEADLVTKQETVERELTLKDIGPIRAAVHMHQGIDDGRTLQRLAASIALPPFMQPVAAATKTGEIAKVLRWLKLAHQENSNTVTLEAGPNPTHPTYIDAKGDNIVIRDSEGVPQDKVKAFGSAPLERPTLDAAGRFVHAFLVNLDDNTQLHVRVKLETSPVAKVSWIIDECETLKNGPTELLKRAQKNGARVVVLEEGLPPVVLTSQPKSAPALSADRILKLAQAALPEHWRHRAETTWEAELSGALALEGAHIDVDLSLKAAKPDEHSRPQAATATFTVRHPRHLYFDHLGAEQQPEVKLRLVSLKSWQFSCDPAGADFHDLIENLQGVRGNTSQLRLPNKGPDHSAAGAFLQAGHVPLPHRMRQGSKTVSWYRSPLIPELPSAGDHTTLPLPARCADELLIFDRSIGMFDASYAAAWELGRIMALADKKFSTALYQWKRARRRDLTHLRQELDRTYLPVAQPLAAHVHLPKDLAHWLEGLTKLEGVPFNYLLPDERLLPPESIRFFVLDPLWLECLRDGAMSVGRVLRTDHGFDHDAWTQQPRPPRISGFVMRSAAVLGFPKMAVQAYAASGQDDKWKNDSHLNPNAYQPLTELRRVNLGADLMLCLFYDQVEQQRELNLLELHLPPEILHFGLEEGVHGGFTKILRDPNAGEQLSVAIAGRDVDPAEVDQFEISGRTLSHLAETEEPAHLMDFVYRLSTDENGGCSLVPWGVVLPVDTTDADALVAFKNAVKSCLKEMYSDSIYQQIQNLVRPAIVEEAEGGKKKQVKLASADLQALRSKSIPPPVLLRLLARLLRDPIVFPPPGSKNSNGSRQARQLLEDAIRKNAARLDATKVWRIGKKRIHESIPLDEPYWRIRTKSTWAWIKGDFAELPAIKPLLQEHSELRERIASIAGQSVHGSNEADAHAKLQAKMKSALALDYSEEVCANFWKHAVNTTSGQGGVLNVSRLFATVADRLTPVVAGRAVTAGDFGLQMLDAAPMVRIMRQGS